MLPLIKATGLPAVDQMQTKWKSELDPILTNSILAGLQLTNIRLYTGANYINHRLGRNQLGWFLTDQDGLAQVYRSGPFNDVSLTLTSNANVNVSLWVF